LIISLDNSEQSSICKAGLIALSNIVFALGTNFSEFIPNIIFHLYKILNETNIDRDLKLFAFSCIGDIITTCPQECYQNIQSIIEIVLDACHSACSFPNLENDLDNEEYIQNLKLKLIECLTSVFLGIGEINKNSLISLEQLKHIFFYLEKFSWRESNPSQELLKNILALIADIGRVYGHNVSNLIKKDFVIDLFKILKSNQTRKNSSTVQWAEDIINKLIS
jgi:hypothetical protein